MEFDAQPTLRGELVDLRPLLRGDYEALYGVARDPMMWEQHPAHDRHERDVFTAFLEEAIASGGALLASDCETGEVVGSSRYFGWNLGGSEVEVGWSFLARSRWGGDFNRDMKRLMIDHALHFVERVVLLVGPTNWRSQKAVEKIGGVRAGVRVDDTGLESFLYEIRGQGARDRTESLPAGCGV